MPTTPATAYNIWDLRERAQQLLPKGLFEFVDRGTEDEVALRNNREAFERIKLRPRVLIDVEKRSQAITLFGAAAKMPVAIAPTGTAGLMWYHGEVALAKAAAAAGIPFTLATGSTTAMETVAEQAPGARLWFQLYMWPERAMSHQLVHRAKAAGFEALILTVDAAVPANREYNLRNGFTIPFTFTRKNVLDVLQHPGWIARVLARYVATTGMPRYENFPQELQRSVTAKPMGRSQPKNSSLNWADVRELRKIWSGPLMIKGLSHPDDARLAADNGADAVIVSNHGGRNLDSARAPIDSLPAVVDAVGNRITVIVDGGFRRGSDVVKALALGAHCVLLGRGPLYGVAAAGEAVAARAITLYRDEIDRVLALLGCNDVAQLGHQHLEAPHLGITAAADAAVVSTAPERLRIAGE